MAAHERHLLKDHSTVLASEDDVESCSPSPRAATPKADRRLERDLEQRSTRVGPAGEFGLVFFLGLTILYLFAFSHSNSTFSKPLRWQARGWAQPRLEARNWAQQHALYSAKAAASEVEIVFYGDSTFELFRGTVHMESDIRGHGMPEVFHKHFGEKYKTANFGIAGDATPQLMWRLQNGEIPATVHSTRAAVILIGSNDLTYASFQGDEYIKSAGNSTAAHIVAIVAQLRMSLPSAQVLLLGLLPRGDQTLMPDESMFSQPSKFSATIREINTMLHAFTDRQEHVRFLDCGQLFVDKENPSMLDRSLMPDSLHPSTAGAEALASCIEPVLKDLVGHK